MYQNCQKNFKIRKVKKNFYVYKVQKMGMMGRIILKVGWWLLYYMYIVWLIESGILLKYIVYFSHSSETKDWRTNGLVVTELRI